MSGDSFEQRPSLKLANTQEGGNTENDEPSLFPLEREPLTRENILKCLSAAPRIPQVGSTCVVARVRCDVVVKYGSKRVHINEANTMRLVHQQTSVALPEVLDAWTVTDSGQRSSKEIPLNGPITYIVMRYVPGTVLHHKWPLISMDERKLLVRRVADMIRKLRTIILDQPGPVGDPIRCEGLYFTDYDAGPFETKEDLARWLNSRLQVCKDFRRVPEDRPDIGVERLVMCHMDLNDHNIIVAEDGSPWLINWGCAGGYPSCFELGSMASCTGEFADMLEEEIYVEEDEPFLARLQEMTFAFSTGALCRRYDMNDMNDDDE